MGKLTPEQKARDMLERMGVEGAQDFTAGELVELANLLCEDDRTCDNCQWWDVSCYECNEPLNKVNDGANPEYRVVRRCGPKFGCRFFKALTCSRFYNLGKHKK